MPETLDISETSPTVKTDKAIDLEKEALAAQYPTVKTPATMELEAGKAQTFKTGKTIAQEEAVAEARENLYQSDVAASKETVRNLEKDYMEYGKLHDRVTESLKLVEALLKRPDALAELNDLKAKIEVAKAAVEAQLDLGQYEISVREPGATPFKVDVPQGWYDIEARLNEIVEARKAQGTVREPVAKEEPTVRLDKAA